MKKMLKGVIVSIMVLLMTVVSPIHAYNIEMENGSINNIDTEVSEGKDKFESSMNGHILKREFSSSPLNDKKYIFIGDSRTVNMSEVVNLPDVEFIAKVGQSYSYMRQIFPIALNNVDSSKETIIVSWFGINNIGEGEKYAKYFNSVELPENTRLVAVSVTDGKDFKGNSIDTTEFNDIMKENAVNYSYVDVTDLIGKGKPIDCTDSAGLHYTKNSDEVFSVIMSRVNEAISQ